MMGLKLFTIGLLACVAFVHVGGKELSEAELEEIANQAWDDYNKDVGMFIEEENGGQRGLFGAAVSKVGTLIKTSVKKVTKESIKKAAKTAAKAAAKKGVTALKKAAKKAIQTAVVKGAETILANYFVPGNSGDGPSVEYELKSGETTNQAEDCDCSSQKTCACCRTHPDTGTGCFVFDYKPKRAVIRMSFKHNNEDIFRRTINLDDPSGRQCKKFPEILNGKNICTSVYGIKLKKNNEFKRGCFTMDFFEQETTRCLMYNGKALALED